MRTQRPYPTALGLVAAMFLGLPACDVPGEQQRPNPNASAAPPAPTSTPATVFYDSGELLPGHLRRAVVLEKNVVVRLFIHALQPSVELTEIYSNEAVLELVDTTPAGALLPYTFHLHIGQVTGQLHIRVVGRDGANGTAGAPGENGKPGAKGKAAIVARAPIPTGFVAPTQSLVRRGADVHWVCTSPPTAGEAGQDGGPGQNGSAGEDGGDAPNLTIEIDDASQSRLSFSSQGGKPGAGGSAGQVDMAAPAEKRETVIEWAFVPPRPTADLETRVKLVIAAQRVLRAAPGQFSGPPL